MENSKLEKRDPSLDVIRCIAFFLVVSVHFFLNSGFYTFTVSGPYMYFMILIRSFSMICVPLFLVLTGYLTCYKQIKKEYFLKLPHLLIIYTLASLLCVLFRIFIKKEEFSSAAFFAGFFNFTHAPYSWYVEMYIGIFLLCPFLNILYKGLISKKNKLIFLSVLIFLTSLPSITNTFRFDVDLTTVPVTEGTYFQLLPDYWVFMYPVLYYFIGSFLREFDIKIRSDYLFILMIAVLILNSTTIYFASYNNVFCLEQWTQHYGPGQVVETILFFLFIRNLKFNNFSKILRVFFSIISKLTFCAYLVSWIFDNIIYSILAYKHFEINQILTSYFIIVPLVIICSLFISLIINFIYDLFSKTIILITKKIVSLFSTYKSFIS